MYISQLYLSSHHGLVQVAASVTYCKFLKSGKGGIKIAEAVLEVITGRSDWLPCSPVIGSYNVDRA